MKKMFKVAAIVAVASLALVACKNNKPAEEETIDTTIEQIAEDEMTVDSLIAEDTTVVAEEPAAPAKKPAAKKAENKPVEAGVAEINPDKKVVVETKDAEDISKTSTVKRTGRR